jgi:hypothetical protein
MIVIHHLAATGGTIFTKALAAQGNCVLLNEINPYFSIIHSETFSPSTPLDQVLARHKTDLSEAEISNARIEFFKFQIRYLRDLIGREKSLILREWSHGDFFESHRFSSSTLPLLEFCEPVSVVLIRHPIDCFLSGNSFNAWRTIKADVDVFCDRYFRFLCHFLERPEAVAVKYEEFAANPDRVITELCRKLELRFNPGYQRELNRYPLSGGSGRSSFDRISSRQPRPLDEITRSAFLRSGCYRKACDLSGYSADYSAGNREAVICDPPLSALRSESPKPRG